MAIIIVSLKKPWYMGSTSPFLLPLLPPRRPLFRAAMHRDVLKSGPAYHHSWCAAPRGIQLASTTQPPLVGGKKGYILLFGVISRDHLWVWLLPVLMPDTTTKTCFHDDALYTYLYYCSISRKRESIDCVCIYCVHAESSSVLSACPPTISRQDDNLLL